MATKRARVDSPTCSLMNAVTNQKYDLSCDKKFVIGRSLDCSLVIEQLYISRRHCIIEYENDQFILYDNTTCSGTFVNGEKLSKGKSNFVVLEHGDLIGFGDKQKLNFIYKFCMFSNDIKKPKFDNNKQENTVPAQKEIDKKSLLHLHFDVINLKVQNLVMINKTKTELSECQKMIDTALESASNLNKIVIKQKDIIEDLTKKVTEYHNTLMIQQDCLDNRSILQESTIEMFKNQINNLVENDLQCPICSEVIFKAVTVNCHHSFCACCMTKWLEKSKICPVCRADVKSITNCLSLDNFITNLCELLGGPIKEQRDNLQIERNQLPIAIRGRRGRKSRGAGRGSTPVIYLGNSPIAGNIIHLGGLQRERLRRRPDNNVEVVDLTNSFNI